MAKRRSKPRRKHSIARGKCKKIRTKAGIRNLCHMKNGKYKFKKLSYKPR